MHVQSSGFLNPTTLAILETAFDEAWATLNGNGDVIKPGELARCMLRLTPRDLFGGGCHNMIGDNAKGPPRVEVGSRRV